MEEASPEGGRLTPLRLFPDWGTTLSRLRFQGWGITMRRLSRRWCTQLRQSHFLMDIVGGREDELTPLLRKRYIDSPEKTLDEYLEASFNWESLKWEVGEVLQALRPIPVSNGPDACVRGGSGGVCHRWEDHGCEAQSPGDGALGPDRFPGDERAVRLEQRGSAHRGAARGGAFRGAHATSGQQRPWKGCQAWTNGVGRRLPT